MTLNIEEVMNDESGGHFLPGSGTEKGLLLTTWLVPGQGSQSETAGWQKTPHALSLPKE